MKYPTSHNLQPCRERINYIKNIDYTAEDNLVYEIKDSFKDSLSYRQVYKNEIPEVKYDTWIYNGNKPDQIVGWKYLVSYPYDNVQFEIGDMIYWNYKDHDSTYYPWLMVSLDTQHYYDVKGHIVLCNNVLERYKDGVLVWSYPCVFNNNMSSTGLAQSSEGVPQAQANAVVQARRNEFTSTIDINDRFVFNGGTFQVTQINDHIAPNYLEFYFKYVPSMEEAVVTQESKVLITPQVLNVPLNVAQTYEVYNYINGEKAADSFEIVMDMRGQDDSDITFATTDNSFTIKTTRKYPLPITITCSDKTTAGVKPVTITITLGNKW